MKLRKKRKELSSDTTSGCKKAGLRFSGDNNLKQTFASKGSGAVRVDFDCTLILHVEAIKQKPGEASLPVHSVKNGSGELHPGVVFNDEDPRKKGNLIKLTHAGRFCKNHTILIKFTTAADIGVTIFGNKCH